MKKVQFIIISTILSFGLIISAALLSNAIDKSNSFENEIVVKGVAEKKIKSDRGVVNIIYSSSAVDLEEGKKNIVEKKEKIIKFIEELNIPKDEYKIQNLKIQPKFVGETNKISNYNFSQSIVISSKNIDKLDEIYTKLQELKLEYNNLEITEPEYYITNIEKYKKDLLVEASENAESRAYDMLKVNNKKVGELKKMLQGQFEVIDNKEEVSETVGPLQQKNKKLRVVVTSIYSIDTLK